MKCVREDLKALITDVLVGEAEPSVSEQVLSHLESCASCREDRDQTARVLGLLKEAPPWSETALAAGADEGDTLSAIQRQKIESLASRPGPTSLDRESQTRAKVTPGTKSTGLSMSWLALAASLSTVGIALFLARQGSERPVVPGAPVAASRSIQQLPQAPEAQNPPSSSAASAELSSATLSAEEEYRAPMGAGVVSEAAPGLKRQIQKEGEQGEALAQAAESNEVQPLKKDADNKQMRDEAGVSGGIVGGIVDHPLVVPEPALRIGGSVAPPPAAGVPPGQSGKTTGPKAPGVPAEVKPRDPSLVAALEVPSLMESRSAARANDSKSKSEESVRPVATPAPPSQPRDMFFESKGTNPFIVTEEDPQATFGLDVDTASYTLTRNYLNRGVLPPAAAVRVEEFVNAFPNNVVAERGGDGGSAFAVRVDGAPSPLHRGYHILRVAMKAKDVDPRERKAARLTFVIDVSGSMAAENRLGLVKRSLALLVDKLDERDTIGIVVYGTSGRRVLAPTSVENRDRIMDAINRLRPEGSTNLQDGLDLGYEMAMESFDRRASNRVVLCTDGVANTGQTEADALLSRIRAEARRGVDMMALGFGMGNYNDALLQRLADEGNGQYAYIDDLGEARAFFLRKLTSVLEVVARDAKAQVEFNPARVERYRLLGYEKRDVADRDFRNDAVDAGEINSGHSVTALFEVKLTGGPRNGKIGTARIRYKTGPRSEGREFSREIVDEAMARNFEQASPAFRTAFVAARFAEHLRHSYWVKDEPLDSVQRLADELPGSQETNQLADLIRRATKLQEPQAREDW